MYILDRLVNGITVSKIQSLTEHRQISPHFPPISVSNLLIDYLVYIRPVEVTLANAILGADIAFHYKYYLFTGPRGQWESTYFSNCLFNATRQHLGPNSGLKLAEIRHVTIGIYRVKCNSPFKDSEIKSVDEEFMDDMGNLQANHGSAVSHTHYAVWPSEMGAIPSIKFKGCKKVYIVILHRLPFHLN